MWRCRFQVRRRRSLLSSCFYPSPQDNTHIHGHPVHAAWREHKAHRRLAETFGYMISIYLYQCAILSGLYMTRHFIGAIVIHTVRRYASQGTALEAMGCRREQGWCGCQGWWSSQHRQPGNQTSLRTISCDDLTTDFQKLRMYSRHITDDPLVETRLTYAR
jgi:hypothetical protein